MSRAWQAERQAEREEEALGRQLEDGEISQRQYNEELMELQRDVRAAYEQDQFDALERVRNEWGY